MANASRSHPANKPRILAIDIGGSHLKASIVDLDGHMVAERVRVATPLAAPPQLVVETLATLVAPLPAYDRISVGFPGVVRDGRISTAPNLGTKLWCGFPLAEALSKRLGKPVRVLNDCDVQGLGVIVGRGLECVLTLGTGVGSAFFKDGRLLPHLELGQHPIAKKKTYDGYLGDAALKKKGAKKWNRRLRKALKIVQTLVNYDVLYLGGGNAEKIDFELPKGVKIVPNRRGITGGARLWSGELDEFFAKKRSARGATRRPASPAG